MEAIKLRFLCKDHGYVDCGFDTPIQEVFFNQRGELGRSCPLCHKSRPMTIERWVGLKDKNGVEIYEGDVVKGRYASILGVVTYGRYRDRAQQKHDNVLNHIGYYIDGHDQPSLEEEAWYVKDYHPFRGNYLEVIGNIYQNPDLLINAA